MALEPGSGECSEPSVLTSWWTPSPAGPGPGEGALNGARPYMGCWRQTQCDSGRVYDAGRAQMASPCGFSGLRNRYLVKLIQTLSCWPPLSGHPTSQHPCPPPLEGDLGSPLAHDCNLHRLLCYSPWPGSGSNCLYSLRHTNDCPSLSPPELWGSEYDSQGPAANHCPPPLLSSGLGP